MPSSTSARDVRVSGAIDRAFGEEFTFAARKVSGGDVDLPRVADATRPEFICIGIWDGPARSRATTGRGVADSGAQNRNASRPSVSVDDAGLVWRPQPNDLVTRMFDMSTYAVAEPMPDGAGRTLFTLTARAR